MLSVIIPSRTGQYLQKTVDDLFDKAVEEIEVIVVLDGYVQDLVLRPNLKIIQMPRVGMRGCINRGMEEAQGKYVMKCDEHCMFDEGFDVKLRDDCEDNWVVIPRRYRLDADNWKFLDDPRPPVDYMYVSVIGGVMHGWKDLERNEKNKDLLIDDTMSFQGSCWFAKKSHIDKITPLETENYWGWEQEPQELCCKTWLSGGRVIVNKTVWYAHLRKGRRWGRMYFMDKHKVNNGHRYSADYWINNRWPKQTRKFEWIIDKFWPVPSWSENWKEDKLENYA
jgi:glycosyltransferase involved in cell wall biosynthesis